jgi:hypothetical protein
MPARNDAPFRVAWASVLACRSDIPTNQLTSVFLRNNGVEPNQIQVDEVRVDTAWAGVTGAVPEPSAATLIFAGAAALLGRRRRAA